MCERLCCTLTNDQVPLACSTVLPEGQMPTWIEATSGGHYFPSTNIPPNSYTPVLFRPIKDNYFKSPNPFCEPTIDIEVAKAIMEEAESGKGTVQYAVQPMMWGFVPFWHRGTNPTDHGLSTFNSRLEGLNLSRMYQHSVKYNKRCVIVCDGFYEWKPLSGHLKQPYLVYAHQDSQEDEDRVGSKLEDSGCDDSVWNGPRPLFLAGIYSIWRQSAEELVYSYTIITRDSNKSMDFLHDRMPVILANPEAVQGWLDPAIQGSDALDHLTPTEEGQISFHPVSLAVGDPRNKLANLPKRVHLNESGLVSVEKQNQKE